MNFKFSNLIPILLLFLIAGCVKEKDSTFTDFSTAQQDFVLFSSAGNTPVAGLTGFAGSTIPVGDTLHLDIYVDFANKTASSSDLTVTIGVDDAARTAYNTSTGSTKADSPYLKMPTSAYKLNATKVTIKAGEHYGHTTLDVYRNQLDPTKSYMVPVSITDGGGKKLTTNLNTIYYHVIGNPIAGVYVWDFTRYNNSDGSGAPHSLSFTGEEAVFVADDPTTIEVHSGYFIEPRYVVTFTNNGGVLSNFKVSINAEDIAAMKTSSVEVTDGPRVIKADPVAGEYIFQYVVSASGNPRYIIDRYYK